MERAQDKAKCWNQMRRKNDQKMGRKSARNVRYKTFAAET